jgi:transmembrane sensor
MNNVDKDKLERFFNAESGGEDTGYIQETFTDESKKTALKSFLAHQWNCFIDNADVPEKNLDHILHKIHFRINIDKSLTENKPFYKVLKFYYRVAAVILLPLLIAGGILAYRQLSGGSNYSNSAWAEIHSTMGSRVSFNLPDGSKGWLNSGSTLKYVLNFNENRRVELEGEAYFEVTPDKFHPFFVKTSEIQLKVLGTTFNLKSYREDKTVEATLLTGMLEIQTLSEAKGRKQTVILKPNQKAIFQRNTDRLTLDENQSAPEKIQGIRAVRISHDVDALPVVSWKDHKLVFVNEPFESLLVKIERWYDVEINLLDNPSDNLSYTGVFEKETVEQALRALELATPDFSYSINKNKITVSFKNKTRH